LQILLYGYSNLKEFFRSRKAAIRLVCMGHICGPFSFIFEALEILNAFWVAWIARDVK